MYDITWKKSREQRKVYTRFVVAFVKSCFMRLICILATDLLTQQQMGGVREEAKSWDNNRQDDTISFSWTSKYYLPGKSQANVSQKGCKSSQKSKIASTTETAWVINCLWTRPEYEALFAWWLGMYIVVLFTSGSCVPSFRAPSNFWLHISIQDMFLLY